MVGTRRGAGLFRAVVFRTAAGSHGSAFERFDRFEFFGIGQLRFIDVIGRRSDHPRRRIDVDVIAINQHRRERSAARQRDVGIDANRRH